MKSVGYILLGLVCHNYVNALSLHPMSNKQKPTRLLGSVIKSCCKTGKPNDTVNVTILVTLAHIVTTQFHNT